MVKDDMKQVEKIAGAISRLEDLFGKPNLSVGVSMAQVTLHNTYFEFLTMDEAEKFCKELNAAVGPVIKKWSNSYRKKAVDLLQNNSK